jgi:hypothetical protein
MTFRDEEKKRNVKWWFYNQKKIRKYY